MVDTRLMLRIFPPWLWGLLLCGIALLVIIPKYQQTAFWADEAIMAYMSGTGRYSPIDPATVLHRVGDDRAWPPASYLLLWGWGHLAGGSEFSGRYLSTLIGLLHVAVVYQLGRQLGQQDRLTGSTVGFLCVVALLGSSFYVYYWQEMRGYTLAMLAVSLTLWCYLRIIQRPSAPLLLYAALTASAALTLYTHYTFAAVLGALGLYHLVAMRRHPAYSRVLLALMLALLSFGPWALMLRLAVHQEIHITRPGDPLTVLWDTLRAFGSGSIFVFIAFLGIGGLAVRRPAGRMIFTIGLLTILFLIAFQVVTGFYFHPRHVLMLFLPFALLIGLSLGWLLRQRRTLAAGLAVFWATFGFTQSLDFAFYLTLENSIRRMPMEMASAMQAHAQASPDVDVVILYITDYADEWIEFVTTGHYLGIADQAVAYLHNMRDLRVTATHAELQDSVLGLPPAYMERMNALIAPSQSILYLRLHSLPITENELAFLRRMSEEFAVTEIKAYTSFDIIRFTRHDSS